MTRGACGGGSFADGRDRDADRQAVADLGDDVQGAVRRRLNHHVGLVRLDLDDRLALGDSGAIVLEPLEDGPLLHRVRQLGHEEVHQRAPTSASTAVVTSAAFGRAACSRFLA